LRKFKVGDRVRVVKPDWLTNPAEAPDLLARHVGKIRVIRVSPPWLGRDVYFIEGSNFAYTKDWFELPEPNLVFAEDLTEVID